MISSCSFAEDSTGLLISARRTCSTLIYPHSTNQILNLYRHHCPLSYLLHHSTFFFFKRKFNSSLWPYFYRELQKSKTRFPGDIVAVTITSLPLAVIFLYYNTNKTIFITRPTRGSNFILLNLNSQSPTYYCVKRKSLENFRFDGSNINGNATNQ